MSETDSTMYFNRELSWLEFNRRVLNEALRKDKPLLERLKFLSIVSSNFDEFFMVRVATLKSEYLNGNYTVCPSRMSPGEQLEKIRDEYRKMIATQTDCLVDDILPAVAKSGFEYLSLEELDSEQRSQLKKHFLNDFFPLLTPVRVTDEARLFRAGNMRLQVGFLLKGPDEPEPVFSVVQLPSSASRVIQLSSNDGGFRFTFLENLIILFAQNLFPGYEVLDHLCFRITRDADFAVDESRSEDFVEAMEQVLTDRLSSEAVRLETGLTSPRITEILRAKLNLLEEEIFPTRGPLQIRDFLNLVFTNGFDSLRDEQWKPQDLFADEEPESMWTWIQEKDRLLIHPFDSFSPVIRLIEQAAVDDHVLAIKMTLYRTSSSSPIIDALERAAQRGKQVSVLVEIKARFDEHRNIAWAERLERAGVIVVYGIAELKVHAKALLIIRREEQGIKRYLHVSTGNYNEKTARLYTDIGLITSRDDLCYEAGLFFNAITGYSTVPSLKKFVMAPYSMKARILQLIHREIDKHKSGSPGHISVKINALADKDMIDALYEAGKAGVRIDLNIRGICMLRPGIKGFSETIRVRSVVDRYLEHVRIIRFENGGNPEVYISSADWMGRNLDRRVELLTPIEDEDAVSLLENLLEQYSVDNAQSYELQNDGTYRMVSAKAGEPMNHAQSKLYQQSVQRHERSSALRREKAFKVRRKAPKAK